MAITSAHTEASRGDPVAAGREALERELYWSADPIPSDAGRVAELRRAWGEVAERLRLLADHPSSVSDPALAAGSRWRRLVKRLLFRLMRPVSRRSDRMGAELAELGFLMAKRLESLEDSTSSIQLAVGALRAESAELQAARAVRPGTGTAVPDEFYWGFEEVMRGDAEAVLANPRQYQGQGPGLLRSRG